MKKQLRKMETWPEPLVDAVLDALEAADTHAQALLGSPNGGSVGRARLQKRLAHLRDVLDEATSAREDRMKVQHERWCHAAYGAGECECNLRPVLAEVERLREAMTAIRRLCAEGCAGAWPCTSRLEADEALGNPRPQRR